MGFWDALASTGPYANNLHLTSRQITMPTPHHSIFTGRMLFLTPNQQCQSTEGKTVSKQIDKNKWVDTNRSPIIRVLLESMLYLETSTSNIGLLGLPQIMSGVRWLAVCTIASIEPDPATDPVPAINTSSIVTIIIMCLQCFDTVGWESGRASGL